MNCVAVITCLGLLCGTLFADKTNHPTNTKGINENNDGNTCLDCSTERKDDMTVSGSDSTAEQSSKLSNGTVSISSHGDIKVPEDNLNTNLNTSTGNSSNTGTDSEETPTTLPSPHSDVITANPSTTVVTTATGNSDTPPPPPPPPTTTTITPTTNPTTTPPPSTTTVVPTTKPTETPTTDIPTNKPTTVPTTTAVTPTQSTSTVSPNPPTKAPITTEIPPTAQPAYDRRFDGPSFIGGIVFALGVTAIGFVAWKFYKARTERNYHTL